MLRSRRRALGDGCVLLCTQVECKKAQPKEVMFPPGTRGRARGLPYTMDAFMLGMGMLSEYRDTHTFIHAGQLLILFTLKPFTQQFSPLAQMFVVQFLPQH